MSSLAELLKDYVAQNPPACGDAQAVVDKIYWAYMESNRMIPLRKENGICEQTYYRWQKRLFELARVAQIFVSAVAHFFIDIYRQGALTS